MWLGGLGAVFRLVNTILKRALHASGGRDEIAVNYQLLVYTALVSHPLSSLVAGGVARAFRTGWVWSLLVGAIPAAFVTYCTYQFVALLVPEALAARLVGLGLSIIAAGVGALVVGRLLRNGKRDSQAEHA